MRNIYANIRVKQTKINFEQNNSDKNCIETHDQLTREKYRFSIASYICSRYIQPDCEIRVCSSDSEGERERVRQEKMMTLDSALLASSKYTEHLSSSVTSLVRPSLRRPKLATQILISGCRKEIRHVGGQRRSRSRSATNIFASRN